MTLLYINLDHGLTIRQARQENMPSLVSLFSAVIGHNSADGITLHLREDRRHTQLKDVYEMDRLAKEKRNFVLEMGANQESAKLVRELESLHLVTVVPEHRQELTTEGGLDLVSQEEHLQGYLAEIGDLRSKVSFFIEPCCKMIDQSKKLGVHCVELHTGLYANAVRDGNSVQIAKEIDSLQTSAEYAKSMGFQVNMGHGLSIENLSDLRDIFPLISEVHIGFSVISRALFVGLDRAVFELKELLTLQEEAHG